MNLGAITAEGGWEEDYGSDDQSYKASEELFFAAPDYKDIRLCEEPEVHEYWESGLTVESLEALRRGKGEHSISMCYHCNARGHLKANCPDRRLANRKPWERAWKARKRKRQQSTGGGNARKPPHSTKQKTGTIQSLV